MNRYERAYEVARKSGRVSWVDVALAPLVVDLQDATGEEVSMGGPYGLRAEVMLVVGDKNNRRYLTVTPSFDREGSLTLHYDTGEKSERYAPGTYGDWHGFNNITQQLPDTVQEILDKFRRDGQ